MTNKQQAKTNAANLLSAKRALQAWQPEARRVRLEGRCPSCKRSGCYVSYQLPDDKEQSDDEEEQCGYFCRACEWSNAGARRAGDTP